MPRKKQNENQHDTIATRITQILSALNRGEKINPRILAQDYNVSIRTIQRDILRLSHFDLLKKDGYYFIDPAQLGQLTDRQIQEFSKIVGLNHLLPTLSSDFVRELFSSITQKAYLVKNSYAENVSDKTSVFKMLENVIVNHEKIDITYQGRNYKSIEPYKLVNFKGVWYIVAVSQNKIKSFCLTKVEFIRQTDEKFIPDPIIEETIVKDDSIWFGDENIHVILSVKAEVAQYFKRRRVISNQKIDKELEDGSLIVSTSIAHEKQILPIVRYWIPNVRIISPADLQIKVEEQLKEYLGLPTLSSQSKDAYLEVDNASAEEILDSIQKDQSK